ncbi:hypothetical protein ACQPU1_08435 [Clostridium paraputrificum]|uniref:hypothetical protein n=1 Tax=Clostridium TaxID=1485 RepID=UPI003D3445AE
MGIICVNKIITNGLKTENSRRNGRDAVEIYYQSIKKKEEKMEEIKANINTLKRKE